MLQMFTLVVLFGLLLPCVISEGINTRVEGDVLLEKRVDAFLSRFVGVKGKYPNPPADFPPPHPLLFRHPIQIFLFVRSTSYPGCFLLRDRLVNFKRLHPSFSFFLSGLLLIASYQLSFYAHAS